MGIRPWLRAHQAPALGIIAIILFAGIFIVHNVHHAPSLASSKTSTQNTSLLASLQASQSQASTSSSAESSTTSPDSSLLSPISSASTTLQNSSSATPAPSVSTASTPAAKALTSAGGRLLGAIVNIVCISGEPNIPTISGSGVIIDPRGIIMTAAHVAQLFTLEDYLGSDKVSCIIRDGSPARRAYLAEPIYVSPEWIHQNPSTLTSTAPQGTGENDFALLGITATATSTPLPASYPYVPLALGADDPQIGDQVAIGSYGAQYLSSSELNYDLYPILVFGPIQDRYTFGTDTVDLISIVGSAASQEGSSGGGIVNSGGGLIGIITTSSITGDFSDRSLNAVTISHIRRSYTTDTGEDLDTTLQNNSVPELISNFASESKALGQFLNQNL